MQSLSLVGIVLWATFSLFILYISVTTRNGNGTHIHVDANHKLKLQVDQSTFSLNEIHLRNRSNEQLNLGNFVKADSCVDAGERVMDLIAQHPRVLADPFSHGRKSTSLTTNRNSCNPVLLELMGRSIRRQSHSAVVTLTGVTEGSVENEDDTRVDGCDVIKFARAQGHHTLRVAYAHGSNASVMQQLRGPGRDSTPGWVLFMVVDAGGGGFESDMLAAARELLEKSTVTYLVIRFDSTGTSTLVDSSRAGLEASPHTGGISLLHSLQYRVQLLMADTPLDARGWGPNTEITPANLHMFAHTVVQAGATCYVYATQGHDLAIPSEATYRRLSHRDAAAHSAEPRPALRVVWPTAAVHPPATDSAPRIFAACDAPHVQPVNVSISYQSHEDAARAEVACVRACCCPMEIWTHVVQRPHTAGPATCCTTLQVACAARVVPSAHARQRADTARQASRHAPLALAWFPRVQQPPDVVFLLLDAVSQQQFARVLPRTARTMQGSGGESPWVAFPDYRIVGANSGPNQIALYSGTPLAGRDVAHHAAPLLWDTLRARGYVTLKTEDGCVRNSNMLQALAPQVDHGEALLPALFCEHHARPHRNAGHPAGSYVLNYSTAFLEATPLYDGVPRAAFVHLIDGHEDTRSSLGALDSAIAAFVAAVAARPNTLAVVVSDHGLHYGRHYTTPAGLVEHQSPLLAMHVPRTGAPALMQALRRHAPATVTPYDVHATVLDVLGVGAPAATARVGALGRSLALPPQARSCATMGIPPAFCPGHADNAVSVLAACALRTCVPTAHVPSVASYYAQLNRTTVHALAWEAPGCATPTLRRDRRLLGAPRAADEPWYPIPAPLAPAACQCYTAGGGWHPCTRSRRRSSDTRAEQVPSEDPSAQLVLCRAGNTSDGQAHIVVDAAVAHKAPHPHPRTAHGTPAGKTTVHRRAGPVLDIVVLNIRQLSKATAVRHLSQTRKLLISAAQTGSLPVCMDRTLRGRTLSRKSAQSVPAAAVEFDVHAVVGVSAVAESRALQSGTHSDARTNATPHSLQTAASLAGYSFVPITDRCEQANATSPHTPAAETLCGLDSLAVAAQHVVAGAPTGTAKTEWTFPPHRAAPPCAGEAYAVRSLRRDLVLSRVREALSAESGAAVLALVDVDVANDNDMVARDHPLVAAADAAAFDEQLRDLLCWLAERHAQRGPTDGTLVLVRGRGGDAPLGEEHDWSTVVEARTQYMGALVVSWSQDIVAATINTTAAEANRLRLVTTLDVHAAVKSLMLRNINVNINSTSWNGTEQERPNSILLKEVPASRNCNNSQIPLARCPCSHEHVS
eukprot:m.717008 g.717008  ORF g.717008 m.717008 type:complete len:1315 (+) comp22985_c0_seq1:264-4208(+)